MNGEEGGEEELKWVNEGRRGEEGFKMGGWIGVRGMIGGG